MLPGLRCDDGRTKNFSIKTVSKELINGRIEPTTMKTRGCGFDSRAGQPISY